MKRQLTHHEEFEILKIIIDKVILLAFILLGVGLYKITTDPAGTIWHGVAFLIAGFIIAALLMFMIIKEYEIIR